ncbi:DUF317 domain-containing protein [Kitasatospora acidiphila]|uniref:DUF317 domain-containing protein n=1 Tax=Kitasatospora acidiphila TaxID=2567942 RepID=A0A540VZ59_9ACTN|nr:DUF317 domain-containing protein [Kitasatospora acidiphila]TQF02023.1 DUF317 domain-containing protein [Kitasatospora acidiphila]
MHSAPALLVQPLRLAGPGDHWLITAPLTTTFGWSRTGTPDGGHRFTSPCQTAVLTREGPADNLGSWFVHGFIRPGAEPLWRATFSSGTPAEITSAFTSVLADGLRSRHRDYLPGGAHYTPDTPASVLADRGWRPLPGPRDYTGHHDQVAPDLTACYRHRIGYQPRNAEVAGQVPPSWSMLAGDPKRPSWRADFTIDEPFYPLVSAALAFSDPAPVQRAAGDIPTRHLAFATVQRPPGGARPRQAPAGCTAPSSTPPVCPAPTAARRR